MRRPGGAALPWGLEAYWYVTVSPARASLRTVTISSCHWTAADSAGESRADSDSDWCVSLLLQYLINTHLL